MTPEPLDSVSSPSGAPPRRGGRRTSLAIAASLLLHLGLWAWWPRVVPVPPLPDQVTLELEVVDTPPPPAEPAPAAVDPGRAPGPRLSPRERVVRAQPPAAVTPAPVTPGMSLSLRDLPAPVPKDLLPTADQLARAGVELAAPPVGAGARGPSRWEQKQARLARAEAARATQARGNLPPEAFELLREIERRYQPSNALVVDLAKAEAGKSREGARWLGRYLDGFFRERPGDRDKPFAPDAAFRRGVEMSALDYAARLCVGFSPEGKPLIESDGDSDIPALDRLARQIVLEAADRQRAGLGTVARACFKFSARLTRVPPIPLFFCGLDERLRPECVYPLKEIASTRVQLDGIELDAQARGSGGR